MSNVVISKPVCDILSVYEHTLCPFIGFARQLAPGAGGAGTTLGAFYFLSSTAYATGLLQVSNYLY